MPPERRGAPAAATEVYSEGANCSRRDAVALADYRGATRRVWDGRVPAPLKSWAAPSACTHRSASQQQLLHQPEPVSNGELKAQDLVFG
jgi:hypothetical protein